MRLHKVVNRVYEGTTYYRWIVSIPPKRVRELGWTDGQELEVVVRGPSIWIQPLVRALPGRRERPAESLEEEVRRKTPSRRSAG
jgi:antitoxin component of MazEF toxin-antitoxin module